MTIRLESTTDSQDQVNDALGIKAAESAPSAPVADAAPAPAAAAVPEAPKAADPAPKGDDDEDDDTAEPDAASEAGRALARHKSRLQKRIDKVTYEKHTAYSERDRERQRAEALARELEALKAGKTEPAKAEPEPAKVETPVAAKFDKPRPKQEDFETFDEYEKAVDTWRDEKAEFIADQKAEAKIQAREKAAKDAADKAAAEQALREREAAKQDRIQAARAKYPDWDTVAAKAADLQISGTMIAHIEASEMGAELAYYFATHPEEAERVANIKGYERAILEMGKLEARIEAGLIGAASDVPPAASTTVVETPAPAPEPVAVAAGPATATTPRIPVSRAPAPMTRPVGSGTTGTTKDPANMTYQEYKDWRAAGGGRA